MDYRRPGSSGRGPELPAADHRAYSVLDLPPMLGAVPSTRLLSTMSFSLTRIGRLAAAEEGFLA